MYTLYSKVFFIYIHYIHNTLYTVHCKVHRIHTQRICDCVYLHLFVMNLCYLYTKPIGIRNERNNEATYKSNIYIVNSIT